MRIAERGRTLACGDGLRQADFSGEKQGGRSAGRIGVEAHEDALGILTQLGGLLGRECGAQGCNGVGKARLVERDAVEVAFDDDQRTGPGKVAPSALECEEASPFDVHRRGGRVDVFRLAAVERPAAESDDFARRSVRRNHQTASVEVVEAALTFLDEPCLGRERQIEAVRLQFAHETFPL